MAKIMMLCGMKVLRGGIIEEAVMEMTAALSR
jgi:hypothetical protein